MKNKINKMFKTKIFKNIDLLIVRDEYDYKHFRKRFSK